MSVDLLHQRTVHNLYAEFRRKIIEYPDVMVADEPHNAYTAVGEFGEFTEEPHESPGNDITVLIPIVKDVAQKVDSMGVILDRIEKIDHSPLRLSRVGEIWCSEMKVAEKICLHQRNPSSSFASSVIMS